MTISNLGGISIGSEKETHTYTLPISLPGKNYSVFCSLNNVSAANVPVEALGGLAVGLMGSISVVISQYQDQQGIHHNYNLPHAQLTGGKNVTISITASPYVSGEAAFIIFEL
jgi:hypothetical protein